MDPPALVLFAGAIPTVKSIVAVGVDEGRGGAEGEVVQEERVVQPNVHGGSGGIGAVVDDLHARGRVRQEGQFNECTTAGQRGPETEGRAIAVVRRVQETAGEHGKGPHRDPT